MMKNLLLQFLVHCYTVDLLENNFCTKACPFVSLSLDWYHDDSFSNLNTFMSVYNPTGAEPVPSMKCY